MALQGIRTKKTSGPKSAITATRKKRSVGVLPVAFLAAGGLLVSACENPQAFGELQNGQGLSAMEGNDALGLLEETGTASVPAIADPGPPASTPDTGVGDDYTDPDDYTDTGDYTDTDDDAEMGEDLDTTPAPTGGNMSGGNTGSMGNAHDEEGPHSYVPHVLEILGPDVLAPGQQMDSGYEWVGPKHLRVYTKITGLIPTIKQAVREAQEQLPGVGGVVLEKRAAHLLRGYNDWGNKKLQDQTKQELKALTGVDWDSAPRRDVEGKLNHLLHSPIPWGEPNEILTPDVRVEIGDSHTLDEDFTEAVDLGNGVFRVYIVSNNKNNSHTGHKLGSFKLQLGQGATVQDAINTGNSMLEYKENRRGLYLDDAAKQYLP